MTREELIHQIKSLLQEVHPDRVILFGSHATGKEHSDSDVDLVVVLNKKGMSRNYREVLKNRMAINRLLRTLRARIPVDVLVYTRDEWDMLIHSGDSFFRQIQEHGRRIL